MQQPATAKLPAHLIVLFDSLSNVDFVSLTKRSLKEKVETLKNAVAVELAKRSHSSPQQNTVPQRDDRLPVRAHSPHPPPAKSLPKPVRNGDRPPDRGRDGDRGQGSSVRPAAKSAGLKSVSAVPAPPKFCDLIKLAADRREDVSGSESPPSSRNKTAARRQSPDARRRPPDHRTPESRTESRSTPANKHRLARSAPDNRSDRRSDAHASMQQSSLGRVNGFENESRSRQAAGRSVNEAAGRPPASSSNSGRSSQRSSDTRNGSNNEDQRRAEEKRPSAKARKKNEEERLLEIRKQRIRDEEERVKLRNDVLSGKKNSADLKTLVTKSQGSTVLSCGRPPPDPSVRRDRPPDRSFQRDGRRGPERDFRTASRSFHYNRPSDRYYDDYDEDEEMDDFIDDDDKLIDDGDEPDVSQHIREIFGYDKRKYADFDDDDIEESSYAQVQKEEMRSAKIGRKEDLEDMRMELMKKKEKMRHLDRS